MVLTKEKIIFDGQRFIIPGITPLLVEKPIVSLAETIESLGIAAKKFKVINVEPKGTVVNLWFQGKTFVLTGKIYGYTRIKLTQMINKKGGIVKPAVSKYTDYLLMGNKPGLKYQAAIKYGGRDCNCRQVFQSVL